LKRNSSGGDLLDDPDARVVDSRDDAEPAEEVRDEPRALVHAGGDRARAVRRDDAQGSGPIVGVAARGGVGVGGIAADEGFVAARAGTSRRRGRRGVADERCF
jgi:hypothetical protein